MAFSWSRWPLLFQRNERVLASGIKSNELAAIDRHVADFMRTYDVPGMSIAITRRGKLVYAKAFGVTERWNLFSVWRDRSVNIRNIFRIASITKPITSVAIMTLVEQGLIKLGDKVFGSGAVMGNDFGFGTLPNGINKARLGRITVQHLLEHTAGGWSNALNVNPDLGDPMFARPQLDQSQLIAWVLANRPLDTAPGTTYAYSNFGYCLLGRIVERVTGQAYADYVKEQILGRCGITNMHIAGNTRAERRSDEVRYYARPISYHDPYDIHVARMDSHGGWLANAVDLVRFAVHVNGFNWFIDQRGGKPFVPTITPSVHDILQQETIKLMTARSARNPSYAKGWNVNNVNTWWHNGNLPGTTSVLVRTAPGFCWAARANAGQENIRQKNDVSLVKAQDDLMWKVVGSVSQWPTHDLFPRYDRSSWWWLR